MMAATQISERVMVTAENSLLFSPQGAVILVERQPLVKNENLRWAYRPQIKILAQEQVRQCERSWLKLCKWQRVHSEWQLFLRRLRWLIKGFHLPLTEINHSTHTHTFSQQRRGAERAEHRDQVWMAVKWRAARPCWERDHPWLSVSWSHCLKLCLYPEWPCSFEQLEVIDCYWNWASLNGFECSCEVTVTSVPKG